MTFAPACPPLAPIHFFRLHVDLSYGKKIARGHRLLDTSSFLGEENFADVSLAWTEQSILIEVDVHKKFEGSVYPKFDEGDAIELFFDTRDLKDAGFTTRFCHHFLILPQEVQGVRGLELTRFRHEDSHPLCNPEDIHIESTMKSREFTLHIELPSKILHGYDPQSFDRLGFTYSIHRPKGTSQNFSLSSKYVSIAQQPSLWASCQLKK